jgi:hypothetical protein
MRSSPSGFHKWGLIPDLGPSLLVAAREYYYMGVEEEGDSVRTLTKLGGANIESLTQLTFRNSQPAISAKRYY